MNRSSIEWCDFTWSPVTGCYHGCKYCYARRIAHRFRNQDKESVETAEWMKKNKMVLESQSKDPYPCNFVPTFHKNRLDQPVKRKKPAKIFVSSMGELFGEWIPDEWIEKVLDVARECPQHTFMFLTKNPKRYKELKFPANCWVGASVENQEKADERIPELLQTLNNNRFLSIEPLHGGIDLKFFEGHDIKFTRKRDGQITRVSRNLDTGARLNWVIIGGQTGPGAVAPKKVWIESIIDQCRTAGVPIFLKNNLNWPEKIQEWLEVMK